VTRISIDVLRSARVRGEEYIGPWFPEPLLTDPYEDPARSAELADSVSVAALLLLERLSPLERAVFVLRRCSGSASPRSRRRWGGRRRRAASSRCGRGATRTRDGLGSRRTAGSASNSRHGSSTRFGKASSTACGSCLQLTLRWSGTGGGKAPQWAGGISGAENVARVLASLMRGFVRIEAALEPHIVNGQPGAIFRGRDNKVLNTWTLDILDGRIQTIRAVINPDKLGHVGPVGDAWAVMREANWARRRTDRPDEPTPLQTSASR